MTDARPTNKAGKPIWPRVPAGFVRAMLAGHSALGLAFAALIYLVCFSGSVAVFTQEFERWEAPQGPVLDQVSPAAINQAFLETRAAMPKVHEVYINLPTPETRRMGVYGYPEVGQGAVRQWNADADGHLVGEGQVKWSRFMSALHYNLHLPGVWGGFVVGLTGVALLSSLISGVLSHQRVFKDAFSFRWGGSLRLQEADLHNRIGIWAMPFHVVIALTGAFLGLTTIIVGVLALAVFKGDSEKAYALFAGPAVADDPRPAPVPDLIKVMAALDAAAPGSRPTVVSVAHPGETGGHVIVTAERPNRLSRGEIYVFDRDAKLLGDMGYENGVFGQRLLSSLTPLHFGWFGGWPVKLAYGLLGLGLTAVTATGVGIWLARRRDKGRPAERWERIWTGFTWSQPAAYGLSAIAALTGPISPLVVWLVATLLMSGASLAVPRARMTVILRLAGGLAMAGAVGAHLATRMPDAVDPMGWIVDVAVFLVAATLGLSVVMRRKAPATVPARA